ncbi:Putative uncharacterized protein [Escherichia coli D6-117.29]|nr:Putative uncharacterized protein [Escherichia coli D6-117.29]
MHCDVVKI